MLISETNDAVTTLKNFPLNPIHIMKVWFPTILRNSNVEEQLQYIVFQTMLCLASHPQVPLISLVSFEVVRPIISVLLAVTNMFVPTFLSL